MADTSKLSDDEMEDIVMKLRQQSKDQEAASKSEESDYDESDDADQGLCVDTNILSVAESYWSNDHDFTHVYDDETQYKDELWLSTVSWAMVASKGEMEQVSPAFKSTSEPALVLALVLPSQCGDASISWYAALKNCWANVSLLPIQHEVLGGSQLLPAQQKLARGETGSNSQEHMPQGSEPSQSGQGYSPPVPGETVFDSEDTYYISGTLILLFVILTH